LKPTANVTTGLYYYRGLIRKTRRIVNSETQRYIDLHPGEDVLIDLIDGSHTLADLNRMVAAIRQSDPRFLVRTGTDLVVQLDTIGAIATGP
jgi:hypothetical protein